MISVLILLLNQLNFFVNLNYLS